MTIWHHTQAAELAQGDMVMTADDVGWRPRQVRAVRRSLNPDRIGVLFADGDCWEELFADDPLDVI